MKKYLYFFCLALIPAAVFAQKNAAAENKNNFTLSRPWFLRGNRNTDTAINFLGTVDANPLLFKVNNVRSGYIDYDSAAANASFGYRALQFNSGISNAAFGYRALGANITGQLN